MKAKLKKNFTIIMLTLLIVIGLFLRVYRLSDVPIYGDELTIILDANSLLHTGKDQTGEPFPLTFSMGAGRPAGYVYGSIPFVAFLGVNEWGVRGLSILSGLVLIGLMYLWGRRLIDSRVGLIVASLMTFSIWDINLSRGGFEAHFALMLGMLGALGLFYASQKAWWLLISAFCFGIVLHTYPTYKVVLPLFLIIFFVLYFSEFKEIYRKSKRDLLAGLGVLGVFGILAIAQTFTSSSETRFLSINVFSDSTVNEQITQRINYERSITNLPSGIAALFHNRILEYAKVIGENYIHNFSPEFLFLNGDKNPRHNMSTMGYFYLTEILTLGLGMLFLTFRRQWKLLALLIGWILAAPLGTALISDPHGLRSAFMIPPLILLSALGINFLFLSIKKRYTFILVLALLLAFGAQFIYFSEKLYYLAPNAFGRFWADGGKFASEEVMRQANSYDYVILSDKIDSIEYAYPVYAKVSASEIITQHPKVEQFLNTDARFKRFGNVYIGNLPAENLAKIGSENQEKSILYIGTIEDKDKLANYTALRSCEQKEILVVSSVNR